MDTDTTYLRMYVRMYNEQWMLGIGWYMCMLKGFVFIVIYYPFFGVLDKTIWWPHVVTFSYFCTIPMHWTKRTTCTEHSWV